MNKSSSSAAQPQQQNSNLEAAVEQLLRARFSCRAFLDKPVPKTTIQRILELSQRTPSWCNTQPWQVVVTSGEGTEPFRKALYEHAISVPASGPDFPFPKEYRGIYLERRRESGFQLYEALGIQRGDRMASRNQMLENFRFFGAPHVAIITTADDLGPYGAIDCGAYIGVFILAAQSLGISTIAQAALANFSSFIRNYFKLQPDRRIVCGISFGFADLARPANSFRTSRANLETVAHWYE